MHKYKQTRQKISCMQKKKKKKKLYEYNRDSRIYIQRKKYTKKNE